MKVRVNAHSFPFMQFQDNELALQYHPKITNQIFCTITMNSWMEMSLMCFNPLQALPMLMSPNALPVKSLSSFTKSLQCHFFQAFPILSAKSDFSLLQTLQHFKAPRGRFPYSALYHGYLSAHSPYIPASYKHIPSGIMLPVINLLWRFILVKYH